MEKSEPSLVPEWLRSSGGGTGSGTLSHHFASLQSDGPCSALAKRNKSSKNTSNSNAPHSSFLSRSSSTNSRKNSSSNGSNKQDTNTYLRSYSSSTRNQHNKGRERLGITDAWDSEYPDSLPSIISGRIEKDTLRRSHSMISRRPDELSQRRVSTDMRNNSHSIDSNGHGAVAVAGSSTSCQKVSFERDFPLLGSDERPTTPDIIRVPSPGLSKGVQGLSIGPSSLIGNEGWTSALAEVPTVVGSNCITSSPTLQYPPYAAAAAVQPVSISTSSAAVASNGLNMAEALVQMPRSHNAPQQSVQAQRSEELPSLGSKRLIPMTSSPKTLVLNPSDKLKPKTATRSNEVASGPKNGLQQMSSLQMGSHPVRSGTTRADGPKSSSAGKLLLLKPTRENVVSPSLKDGPGQTINVPVIANGQSSGAPVASALLKHPNNVKLSSNERKTSYNLNVPPVVDKRLSLAQLRSRNDFFNLVRKKSMSSTSAAADSGSVSSSLQNSDELKETVSGAAALAGNASELKCNGEACNLGESSSDHKESVLDDNAVIYPSEEEEAFLRSLGWEDNTGDEGGLTEEEINAFVQKYMKHKPASKLSQNLQLKIATESDPQASCSAVLSSELRTTDSSL